MMDDRDEQQFNEWLQDAAKTYHEPRPTPREELWTRIAAERERRRIEKPVIVLRPWFRWGLGIAAVLAVGVGIGRWTAPGLPPGSAASTEAPTGGTGSDLAYQIAATQYLSRAEAFLTAFRADAREASLDPRFTRQADDLLTSTRLMLDSKAADDPRVRALLEELELVLVQMALLSSDDPSGLELDLITRGMEQRGVLPKLRSAIPAGPAITQAQGVL